MTPPPIASLPTESDEAVIRPVPPRDWPAAPETAIMVGNPSDMRQTVCLAGLSPKKVRHLLNSQMFFDPDTVSACIAGPFIGAPYAVILLEILIAWGVRRVIFFGWCGAIHPDIRTGDLLIPTAAFISDGTAPHYLPGEKACDIAMPSAALNAMLTERCRNSGISFHNGPVWTTDAVFRERRALISHFRDKGALAVEMEASALFAAGAFRGIEVSAILAVSDELHAPAWRPGFGDPRFRRARRDIMALLSGMIDNSRTSRP